MKHPILLLPVLLLFISGLIPNLAGAPIITLPTGLNPGDTYRLVFVTDGVSAATSSSIATYNAFVSAEAASVPQLAALSATWTAIASTATTAARDNTNTNPSSTGSPIYLLSGIRIALNNSDLWDAIIAAPINFSSSGTTLPNSTPVFTGTDSAGLAFTFSTPADFALGTTSPVFAVVDGTAAPWVASSNQSATTPAHFYSVSSVITVAPVPEPSEALLITLGLVICVSLHRRYRRPACRLRALRVGICPP